MRHDVDIIQVCENAFSVTQSGVDLRQRIVLCDAIERRHEGVTLFSSFCLLHVVVVACRVGPGVVAGAAVPLGGVREEGGEVRPGG